MALNAIHLDIALAVDMVIDVLTLINQLQNMKQQNVIPTVLQLISHVKVIF